MRVIFTVTNDLSYDQRMHRICGAMVGAGYQVTLVGRILPNSIALEPQAFDQVRFELPFQKGFAFYAVYNLRLCWFLLWAKYDAVCSVDLDTLPAGCMATLIRRKKRVFDAHEYFSEVPEVVHRPVVKWFWEHVAKCFLPFYRHAYTVGQGLAAIFEQKYGLPFSVVRNVPKRIISPSKAPSLPGSKIILYQGALNEGRGIETLIMAMHQLTDCRLILAGEGDLSQKLRALAASEGVSDKVAFLGFLKPDELKAWTQKAWLTLNLLENKGLSYYYSLANKFFDSVQAQVPVLTMDFPEYRALNAEYEVAILLPDLNVSAVVRAIQTLESAPENYAKLQENCRKAAEHWIWEKEEVILQRIWATVASE
jgi:glycosyltransferase involved in cell wall biosynthesis